LAVLLKQPDKGNKSQLKILTNWRSAMEKATETPLKVLLAEPARVFREIMDKVLRQQGYQVVCVNDGFEVLCRLPELRPDVLLLSTALPRLTGPQICSLLRQSPDFKALRVIILTEANSVLDHARADFAAADACLVRPFRTAELREALTGLYCDDFLRTAQA
jgi:twitching motility two-component system response regulator PilG